MLALDEEASGGSIQLICEAVTFDVVVIVYCARVLPLTRMIELNANTGIEHASEHARTFAAPRLSASFGAMS